MTGSQKGFLTSYNKGILLSQEPAVGNGNTTNFCQRILASQISVIIFCN